MDPCSKHPDNIGAAAAMVVSACFVVTAGLNFQKRR